MHQADALEKGRDNNRLRAEFKRYVRGSTQPRHALAAALDDLPEHVRSMTVLDYLRIVPGIGHERGLAVIAAADPHLAPVRPVGTLTERQRGVLAHILTRPTRRP